MADGSTIMARVLLDSASYRTFMTGKLATQLKLKPQQRELLSVSTFAAKTPKDVDTYVVNFNLITKDQSVLQLSAKQDNWPYTKGTFTAIRFGIFNFTRKNG